MIEFYIEIKVVPDIEFSKKELMSALFLKLHVSYNSINSGKFAVSFPDYDEKKMSIGDRIRIFSSYENLHKLSTTNWEKGLKDYLSVSEIQKIPNSCNYAFFKRVQVNSIERERKRKMMRMGISYAEALILLPKSKCIKLPYIDVKSLSSKSIVRIYIKKIDCDCCYQSNTYNYSSYGFSSTSPVPIF